MKLTKRKIPASAILMGVLITAVTIASFIRSLSARDDLVVRLIDERTGEPMANVNIIIQETYGTPFIRSLPFLPRSIRFRESTHRMLARDGTFTLRRMWTGSSLVQQDVRFNGLAIPHLTYFPGRVEQYNMLSTRKGWVWQGMKSINVPNSGDLVIRSDARQWIE